MAVNQNGAAFRLETAESVTVGHPDKLCDFIADTILDEALAQDRNAHVAMEIMLAHDSLFIGGEISADAELNCTEIAMDVIKRVGYEAPRNVHKDIDEQSGDIAQAVDKDNGEQGAGDQGIVYGYATDETLSRLPLAADLAHRITDKLMEMRYGFNEIQLGPDGKAQVTVAYDKTGSFDHIASVLVSAQHDENADIEELRRDILNNIIRPALQGFELDKTEIIINPSGRFVTGGFKADTGLTGRKLMVDTYGGIAHHGGGAMSGKDPSKVDRSGAYMARYIANTIIAAGLAERCEVSIAYAIGRPEPTAINVDSFESWQYTPDRYIAEAVRKTFDASPAGIEKLLHLKQTKYAETAIRGHFGTDKDYPWEKVRPEDIAALKGNLHDLIAEEDEGGN